MQLRPATILFADLRGFSGMAAEHAPDSVFGVLNGWVARMSDIVAQCDGTIAGFMGDAIMAVFDAPRASVTCAVDMQIAMTAMNKRQAQARLPELYLSIGLHSGEVMAGVVGSDRYSVTTVIGPDVNLAARIEAFALRGQILASEAACAAWGSFAQTGKPMEVFVKGRDEGLLIREVHGIPSLGKIVPRQERRRSERVPVHIPVRYQLLGNDMVSQVRAQGTILDIGEGGVLIEVDRELGLFEELKLEIQLPLVGYRAADFYGRVVNVKRQEERYRCGVEFTALGDASARSLRKLVHLLIQGTASRGR